MSLEVDLVKDVKSCDKCKWFWGPIPPYGPFPAFDWSTPFPSEAIDTAPQSTSYKLRKKWMKAPLEGAKQIDPAIIYGCRKAPIMTIGINPNMTSYFPSTDGAVWAYPSFSDPASYAYYYRHHTIYQESVPMSTIKNNIKPGSEIKATGDGWLVGSERSSDHRWMLLTVQYVNRKKPVQYEVAWGLESRTVVLVDRTYQNDIDAYLENPAKGKKPTLKKGDVIAGDLVVPHKDDVQIYENGVGYYQRFLYMLRSFEKLSGGKIPDDTLRVGEDVCQHDMIACASPGWSSKYDIPTERITHNCVFDQAFVVSQFVQSQPSVLVIVGGSSLEMFMQIFAPFSDLTSEESDIFNLLKETTTRKRYITIDIDGLKFKTRIITTPHFSYGDNFRRQARFSPEAWTAYKADFADDVKVLEENGLVQTPAWNGVVAVEFDKDDKKLQKQLSTAGWDVIMAYYYEPYEMVGQALADELKDGGLGYDAKSKRLTRATGPCDFCKNPEWTFPEGCAYKNINTKPYKKGYLEGVVKKIIKQAEKARS